MTRGPIRMYKRDFTFFPKLLIPRIKTFKMARTAREASHAQIFLAARGSHPPRRANVFAYGDSEINDRNTRINTSTRCEKKENMLRALIKRKEIIKSSQIKKHKRALSFASTITRPFSSSSAILISLPERWAHLRALSPAGAPLTDSGRLGTRHGVSGASP